MGQPAELVEAMGYAVLDGGKRLRPLLVNGGLGGCTRRASVAGQHGGALRTPQNEAALRAHAPWN